MRAVLAPAIALGVVPTMAGAGASDNLKVKAKLGSFLCLELANDSPMSVDLVFVRQ